MKDWRGVVTVLFLAGLVFGLAVLEPGLRMPAGVALLALLGAFAQRSKLDALVSNMLATGTTLAPPPGRDERILVPTYPPLPTMTSSPPPRDEAPLSKGSRSQD